MSDRMDFKLPLFVGDFLANYSSLEIINIIRKVKEEYIKEERGV